MSTITKRSSLFQSAVGDAEKFYKLIENNVRDKSSLSYRKYFTKAVMSTINKHSSLLQSSKSVIKPYSNYESMECMSDSNKHSSLFRVL